MALSHSACFQFLRNPIDSTAMSANDSSTRRAHKGDAAVNEGGTDTPVAFYVMMGAIVAAILYALIAMLFL